MPGGVNPAYRITEVLDEAGFISDMHAYEGDPLEGFPDWWHRALSSRGPNEHLAFRWNTDCNPAVSGSDETEILDLSLVLSTGCTTNADCGAGAACYTDVEGPRASRRAVWRMIATQETSPPSSPASVHVAPTSRRSGTLRSTRPARPIPKE